MRRMKPCAIWCARGKRRRRINCGRDIDCRSFCCAIVSALPAGTAAWTEKYRRWLSTVRFAAPAQEATRADYVAEVEHVRERIGRLDRALDEARSGEHTSELQ